ncbi:efflux RND transporter periplasmic adaptor subunit (plasmid) [Vibrio sp. SS-MA-C1-2]|uniref:efflux RND transporter periplasmic adaptor subunit n=1 Tax=Vibrio sp. SS-MA-C1-2 TaxID=2908646 RepID=UPI001F19629A|nr:efflux RND transporter periplasmic adaptor subunit [Vibrio sp. SS-MA-C1-2]UJF20292.1 efflux RND transporter periplasmic adaptor subunit [Vibrio sp. SS-MA-C1-2]
MKINKLTLLISTVIFLAGCNSSEQNVSVPTVPRPVKVEFLDIQHQTHQSRLPGVIKATNQADVAFRVPGTINALYIKEGSLVKEGDKLAQLDSHDYQVTVDELKARLAEAKATATLAKIELDRIKIASEGDAVAQVNLDRAKTGLTRANLGVEVVQQNLKKAQDALRYTTLYAPFSGKIAKVYPENFEQTAPGVPVLTLLNPDEQYVETDVPESLIDNLAIGVKGTVSIDNQTISVPVTITEIGHVVSPITRTYPVKFTFDKPLNKDLIEKVASVWIKNKSNYEADWVDVPLSALYQEVGENPAIWFVIDDHAKRFPVMVGKLKESTIAVKGDFPENGELITGGVHFLIDNQRVGQRINRVVKG